MPRVASLLIALAIVLPAQEPGQLHDPVRLRAQDGSWIDAGDGSGYAGPTVADVDGDGLRDLVLGHFAQGRFRVYRNVGTDAKPEYAPHHLLKAGEQLASVPMG